MTTAPATELLPRPPRLKSDGSGYDWHEFDRYLQRLSSLLGTGENQKSFNIPTAIDNQNSYLPRIVALESLTASLQAGYYKYADTVLNGETFTLPSVTSAAWGFVVIGVDDSDKIQAIFTVDEIGTVDLWMYNGGDIDYNADTANCFCIGTSVANPVICKNNMGSTKDVLLNLWYH